MLLHFIGQRRAAFTLDSPTFIQDSEQRIVRYYVEPEQPVEVADADGKALLKRDPHLWTDQPPAAATNEGEFSLTRTGKTKRG